MKKNKIKLQTIQLEVLWPDQASEDRLRVMIRKKLSEYGEPLRWAITSVRVPEEDQLCRRLRIEAVVILL